LASFLLFSWNQEFTERCIKLLVKCQETHTNLERCLHAQHLFISAHLNTSAGLLGAWAVSYSPPGKEPEMPRIQEAVIPPQLTLGYEWILCRFLYFVVSRLLLGYPVDARESDLSSSLAEWFIRVAASYR
jgi:hypothetical protein